MRIAQTLLLFLLLSAPASGAFTEFYVTATASGGGDGSIGDPFTLAEALADTTSAASNGVRYNILKGAYSSGAASVATAGSTQGARVYRGYNSTIGDLVGDRTDGNGELNATNYPVITLTGSLVGNSYVTFESLKFTGTVTAPLVGNTAMDNVTMKHCVINNAGNSAAVRGFSGDNYCVLINCDIYCSGATHGFAADFDIVGRIQSCRIRLTGGDGVALNSGCVIDTLIYGGSSDVGIDVNNLGAGGQTLLSNNTLYDLDTAIYLSAPGQYDEALVVSNNFASDCSKWLDSAYVATANQPVTEINNWLYNITTPRTGISDFPISRQIGPTSGVAGAYFEDAAGGDFNLVTGAPGRGAGLWPYRDVGALQHEDSGGGGGDKWPFPGMRRIGQ